MNNFDDDARPPRTCGGLGRFEDRLTALEAAELARLLLSSDIPLSWREERFLRDMPHGLDAPSSMQVRWLRDLHRRAVAWLQHGGWG